jgi:hypothetical protein
MRTALLSAVAALVLTSAEGADAARPSAPQSNKSAPRLRRERADRYSSASCFSFFLSSRQ